MDAARLRLRPILMTAFSFILGCVPLALASGAGALSRRVMGYAVIGGMTGSYGYRHFPDSGLFLCGRKWSHKDEGTAPVKDKQEQDHE